MRSYQSPIFKYHSILGPALQLFRCLYITYVHTLIVYMSQYYRILISSHKLKKPVGTATDVWLIYIDICEK